MSEAALVAPTSFEAFLDWEEAQPERYELLHGRVTMMTGGTLDHAAVARNLTMALHGRLKAGPCAAFQSDVKVVTPRRDALYTDVLVHCGERRGQDTRVTDPILVAEVLSPATAERDLNWKRWAYQSVPSIRHILFVAPSEPIVEVVTRDTDGETLRSILLRGLDQVARLPGLELELPLAEIYAGVLG